MAVVMMVVTVNDYHPIVRHRRLGLPKAQS